MTNQDESAEQRWLEPPVQTFREFLYADLDRVRSLLAQRSGGVPEEENTTETSTRKFHVGVQRYLGYDKDGATEASQQRSLLDALFPELESLLEAEGWLTDISDMFHLANDNYVESLRGGVSEGAIVRLTADGQLFDSEYITQVLAGTSIAASGLDNLMEILYPSPPGKGTKKGHPGGGRRPKADERQELEDRVEDFNADTLGGVQPGLLRSFVRVSRGLFTEGLHLIFSSDAESGWTATSRLQQGRRYLDAEPEIVFSRYGTQPQRWTIVGTVGYFSEQPVEDDSSDPAEMTDKNGRIDRPGVISVLNSFMEKIGGLGISDVPPHPGFSIVPMAVYRTIPKAET